MPTRITCPGISGRSVTVTIGENVQIDKTAKFGQGVVIGHRVKIGPHSNIGAKCYISHTTIGPRCNIGERSRVEKSQLHRNVQMGGQVKCQDFTIDRDVRIGNKSVLHGFQRSQSFIAPGVVIGQGVRLQGPLSIGEGVQIGDDTNVTHTNVLRHDQPLYIGRQTLIGSSCNLEPLQLGDRVIIENGVHIYGATLKDLVNIGSGQQLEGC